MEGDSLKLMQDSGTIVRQNEPNTPCVNRAERYIGMLKQSVCNVPHDTNYPIHVRDYCAQHQTRMNNATACNLYQWESITPYQTIYHREPDISNICQFKFYDWFIIVNKQPIPIPKPIAGTHIWTIRGCWE